LLSLGANVNTTQWGFAVQSGFTAGGDVVRNWTDQLSKPTLELKKKAKTVDLKFNSLNGLKMAVLGDSISDVTYIDTPDESGVWWGLVATYGEMEAYANAIAGTSIATGSGGGDPFHTDTRWQSLDTDFDPDIILIFGGTNDFGSRNVSLGTNADPESLKTSFYGALKYLYHSIMNEYPNAKVFHMTPISRSSGSFPAVNGTTGENFKDFITAIREVASDYNVAVIDTYQNSGINFWNGTTFTSDGLHPNEIGHKRIAEYVVNEINSYFI
jgi:lysophospholipase L1-like esterase